jgi:hypothetical protein
MNCGNCKFYDGDNGSCLRHPPQLVLFATDKTATPIVYQTCSAWPNVDPEKWCGEWQAKPVEVEAEVKPVEVEAEVKPVEVEEPKEATRLWNYQKTHFRENIFCRDLCMNCQRHIHAHIDDDLKCIGL